MDNLAEKKYFKLNEFELEKIQKLFKANYSSDDEIKKAIKKYVEKYNYLMDPHTATWIKCYEKDDSEYKKILFSTAEWTKFAPTILNALNEDNEKYTDEFALNEISKKLNIQIPEKIKQLFESQIAQKDVIEKDEIQQKIIEFLTKNK